MEKTTDWYNKEIVLKFRIQEYNSDLQMKSIGLQVTLVFGIGYPTQKRMRTALDIEAELQAVVDKYFNKNNGI